MTLPIAPVVRPLDLIGADNGRLPAELLATIGTAGKLYHAAARAWRALAAQAERDGVPLTWTYGGTYRTFAQQETLFRSRYTTTELAGRPSKWWNGVQWWLRPGMATAAVPGTSNHGLGLAVDTALDSDPSDGLGPDDATGITAQLAWLVENAPRFGWSWEMQSEPWHIRYVAGDAIPQAVLDFEQPPAPPLEPIPDPQPEVDDMRPFLFRLTGYTNQFLMTPSGPIHASGVLSGRWIAEGFDQVLVDNHPQFRKSTLVRCGLTDADLVPGGSPVSF